MGRPLIESCATAAWSQWVALGVSGTGVRVAEHAIDLEAAILLAPVFEQSEPRLYGEILDWCIQFGTDFTSVSCLKHHLKLFTPGHRAAFDRFAAVVNRYGRAKWPAKAKPREITTSGKSQCRLERPTAVALRARKVFGINARADILTGLALEPRSPEPRWTDVARLEGLGFTRRNITEALNDLHAGGMLGTLRVGRTMYALARPGPLRAILDPLPDTPGQPWVERFAVAAELIETSQRTRAKSITSQAVEVRTVIESRRRLLAQRRIDVPDIRAGDPWPVIEEWMDAQLQP